MADNSMSAFEIDERIYLKLEKKLAESLGLLILETNTTNTALLALGHQLRNLSDVTIEGRPSNSAKLGFTLQDDPTDNEG